MSGFSSDDKRFHGFRTDSKRKPSTDSKRFRSAESGMGWDGYRRGKEGEMPSWSERRADVFDFCRQHLADEHLGFCVTAAIAVRMTGRKLTRNAILERLHDSDRTAEQLRAKGWLE